MDLNILKRLGFTDGEIRVYEALLLIQRSTISNIMKKSKISSSKIYLILDKLINKGLVSFVVENNVKVFQVNDPSMVLDFVEKKKEELDQFKTEFNEKMPLFEASIGSLREESAQVYKSFKGMKAAFNNLLRELEPGEGYSFFSVSKDELSRGNVVYFFQDYHKRRVNKEIHVRGIAIPGMRRIYERSNFLRKFYKVKFFNLTLPVGMVIGKKRIIHLEFERDITAYEIVSESMVQKYKIFFDKIWKQAES